MELIHPVDTNGIRTGTLDVRTHGVEEVGQVNDMGLLGGILNGGHAVRQGGGHHDVHRCADGDHVQIDGGALHAAFFRAGKDEVALMHLSTHGDKALDVLVDRTNAAKVAPAGHRDLRLSKAAKQRADEIVGCTDLMCQLLRHLRGGDMTAVDLHVARRQKADLCTQLLQDLQQGGDVGNLRDVFDAADAVHQQRGGNDGNSGIFGAADMNLTEERMPALNDIFCHKGTPLVDAYGYYSHNATLVYQRKQKKQS